MKDYHFENDNHDFDKTIRLSDINEEMRKMEADLETDDLGDKNAFLDAFESERFDSPRSPSQQPASQAPEQTLQPQKNLQKTPKANSGGSGGNPNFLNKKTMALLALGCVCIAILAFALAGGLFSSESKTPPVDEEIVVVEPTPMLVQGVLNAQEIIVFDIKQSQSKTIAMTAETTITDALGRTTSANTIATGDVIMAVLDETGRTALTIDFADIMTQNVSNVVVDTANRVLTNDDFSFSYHKETLFLYNGEEISPADLEACDELVVKGYDETVWSVEVMEFHGYINITNQNNIIKGKFKLDDKEPIDLANVGKIAVKEGSHTITISGENIETRTDAIFVETGEIYEYDLSKAQEKVGVLIINANISDYRLYINGALVDSTIPSVLPLGEYDLVILKSGYAEWSQHVSLMTDTLTVDVSLQKESQNGIVVVTSNVEGANVFVDNQLVGTTPLEVSLSYGNYSVKVDAEGYQSFSNTIIVSSSTMHVWAELH